METEQITFKTMCAQFDVPPRTLRYYEYIELLQPERRGRSRFYGPREIARMTLILRGRRFGFSLEELRQWLSLYEEEGNTAQMQAWIPIAEEKLKLLEQQKAEVTAAIEDLRQMIGSVSADLP